MTLPTLAQLSGAHHAPHAYRDLVERSLAAITDPAGEGARTFLHVDSAAARDSADAADAQAASGQTLPLLGVPISIKDLFDVAGQVTTAGSVVLAPGSPAAAAPAVHDSTVVARLRAAGAVLVGRTNMTEFAYSGLGLNPHYGTPKNRWDRANARIPGGSSSGAAVSVTDGMCVAAIGSDTGGSVRIPAALCGLTGFKPTARRVPMAGVLPLAPSLDSIGPLGNTVDCCARLDAVLAGELYRPTPLRALSSLRLGVLQGYVLHDLDDHVSRDFARALTLLSAAGAKLEEIHFSALDHVQASNRSAATQAYAWHRHLLPTDVHRYDPHVSTRILQGAGVLAADYLDLMQTRRDLIAQSHTAFSAYDAILLPTTPRIAPRIADLVASDNAYFDANGAMLRNTSIFNFLDGCALTIPCHRHGDAPVGLMLAGTHGSDAVILQAGVALEAAIAPHR